MPNLFLNSPAKFQTGIQLCPPPSLVGGGDWIEVMWVSLKIGKPPNESIKKGHTHVFNHMWLDTRARDVIRARGVKSSFGVSHKRNDMIKSTDSEKMKPICDSLRK